MNKKELAEQIAKAEALFNKHWNKYNRENDEVLLSSNFQNAMVAAIIEAMGEPESNWKQLRDKFFKECTETYEAGKGLNVLRKVSYNIAPHDLFEWFKKELQSVEAMGVQPGMSEENNVASDNDSSIVPCDAPFNSSNSNYQ